MAFGQTSQFAATVHADFVTNRLYAVELVVIMGTKRKTLPVVIDLRRQVIVQRTAR